MDIQPQHEYYDKKSKFCSAFDCPAIPRARDSDEDMEERQISKSRMKPQRPSILGLAGRLYPGFSLSKKVEATKDSEFIHTALLALVEKSRHGAGKGVFGRESFTQARVGILRARTQGKPLHQGKRHRRVTAHGGFRVLGISTWMKDGDGSVD